MITKDGSIVRVAPIVDTSAIRQAVLDEDGHIRELPVAEWAKFPWDDVRTFMHEYPVFVLPTTELLDVLDDFTLIDFIDEKASAFPHTVVFRLVETEASEVSYRAESFSFVR